MLSRSIFRLTRQATANIYSPTQTLRRHFTSEATKKPANHPILPSEDPALLGKGAKPQPVDIGESPAKSNFVNPITGEVGGPKGPEPTRYGDFEKGGRCYDF